MYFNILIQISDCKCQFECKSFTVECMVAIFTCFYNQNYNQQTSFLSSLMDLVEPKQRKVDENISRRHVSVHYFLFKNNQRVRICQRMICNTLKITPRRIQMLINKIKNGVELEDYRGKHNNRPHKVVDAEKETVIEHIARFPTQSNHYSRESSKNDCLSADLTLSKMYNMFKRENEGSDISYRTYR